MFETTSEFEKVMLKILNSIHNGESDLNSIFKEYGEIDAGDALAECIDRRYIIGYSYLTSAISTHVFTKEDNVRLTFKGLSFLEHQEY